MVLGVVLTARLYFGPLQLGAVVFDVSSLIYAAAAVLVGFQAVMFAVFAKVFAISEGLLPSDERFDRAMGHAPLEGGLIVGMLLLALGIVGSVVAVLSWSSAHFGPLSPRDAVRAVVPSMLAVSLGVETVLASFFLGVLRLRVRRD